ncbi:MAG: IS21 family transposase [Proteobacteria bacterium]|nr:IS21 family transposase [Pseudomonadota bacterium]MBU1710836.1 IS21 family transposase [Pseudomonadota bacterium]
MINKRTIFEIHHLKNEGLSVRDIANQLQMDRGTVGKYLKNPSRKPAVRTQKTSKLDPYRDFISHTLDQYPSIKAPVILQKIKAKGFDGEITIVRSLLRVLRGRSCRREPFIRFESEPGQQLQVDWGHFQSLKYGEQPRKLYALAIIESHSRMLYVYFSHSQKQEYLHMGLLAAFHYFGGCPKELVVDNMMTAVTERAGSVIRFNESFLDFLRPFRITPRACNVRAPYEKGKVENAIKYIRQNFWPTRNFTGIDDAQRQMLDWLDSVANCRVHQTTGEKPVERLQKNALQALPIHLPDTRETLSALVHKDFGIRFDANVYTVPPWTIGKYLTVKADLLSISLFYRDKLVAEHPRIWDRKKRQEHAQHREHVKKMRNKLYQDRQVAVFLSFGQPAADYLEKLADTRAPIKKNVAQLLTLKDEYGDNALIYALGKASDLNLYGAEYVRNILYQEMTPTMTHQPVKLKQQSLNQIRLVCPSLQEYDAIALQRRKKK